jgi:hypothetical protein
LTLAGATADLLHGQHHCFTVDPSDKKSLAEAILALHRSWNDRCGFAPTINLAGYERRNLTGQLSTLLNAAIGDERVAAH